MITGVLKIIGAGMFLGLGAGCGAAPLEPLSLKLSFEDELDGWESQASLAPAGLEWRINPVSTLSFEGTGSAKFFLDATEGEGAIWLRKLVPITIGKDDLVTTRISLRARVDGLPPHQPQLLFWARGSAPFDRHSFTAKEALALTEAWGEYSFTGRVTTSGKSLWFAFGIEVPRSAPATVYIDNVSIEVTR